MKTALYARVSSEKQDVDLSISAQLKALKEYAARNGHEVVKEYVDEAESGKTTARPAFREMISAQTPFGYCKVKVNDGSKERPKLEIEPNQARTVAHIFNQVLEGKGLMEVAKHLNREGIAGPRGKGWVKTTIHKILTNEVYTGTLVWGRNSIRDLPPIRVDNAWPAIIGKDTFDRAQILLKDRAPVSLHPKRVASRYLLSGLARCGHCDKALVGQDAKSGQFAYYVCGILLKKGGLMPNPLS